MKNRFGYSTMRFLSTVVVAAILAAILLKAIVVVSGVQRFSIMRKSARNFSKYVALSDQDGDGVLYLRELVSSEHLEKIKSPFSSGYCDLDESKIEIVGLKKYVTLQCDKYLINHSEANEDKYKIYQTSKWTSTPKSKDYQKMERYNCEINGKVLFKNSYDLGNFLHYINDKYKTHYTNVSDIKECKVLNKTFYRSLIPIEK